MRVLLLFLDGIGLGDDDPQHNPFIAAHTPTLCALANGRPWTRSAGFQVSARALFIPTDAQLGVPGRPQSGSSQAAILTGQNVPALIGEHYGPKPNAAIRQLLNEDNLFVRLRRRGQRAVLLDAYPPDLLARIARGKTLPSSIQQAAMASGQRLFSLDDLRAGRALTPEWTGEEWRQHLKLDCPLYSPQEAGRKLAELARSYDFAMHSHWMTDYVGHRGDMEAAVRLLERFDGVLAGLLEVWDDSQGVVIVTSDHGNVEHIGQRNHTENLVPTLVVGQARQAFADLRALTDFVPRIAQLLGLE
ncbi:MAG: alkaline phosphatase family protein [Anaerolineae bacterium]|nr:alkaline phosphatase family protein [Anaerolineae bacterium]MDW8173187.1 hypothetical protein [Anaerolineae bacterium]